MTEIEMQREAAQAKYLELSKTDPQRRGVLVRHSKMGNTTTQLDASVPQGQVREVWAKGAKESQDLFAALLASVEAKRAAK